MLMIQNARALALPSQPLEINVICIEDWITAHGIEQNMGFGDEIIATGMARGALARGKRIAFGNGRQILWSHNCEPIFRYNPNIAPPGSERAPDLEWVSHYKHNRLYMYPAAAGRWVYNRDFKIQQGEMFFNADERAFAAGLEPGFILIEPRVKPVYPNKQWGRDRYSEVARILLHRGHKVCQFNYGADNALLYDGVKAIPTPSIRAALAALTRARLFIGCEGAMTHGAAAVGVDAVVLFGGFTDPMVLGYPGNINLTGGADPCGMTPRCAHCKTAMENISVELVCNSVETLLGRNAT